MIADGTGLAFSYTTDNRLSVVSDRTLKPARRNKPPTLEDAPFVTYAYNGLGQRVAKDVVNAAVTQFVYGTGGELLAELDAAGEPQVEYVYLNGQLLATVAVTATAPSGNPLEVIVDNGAAGTTSTGSWSSTTDRKNAQYGGDYLVAAGGTGSTYRWTPGLTAGSYEVYAWWVADRKAASNVPFTVAHNGTTTTIPADQTGSGGQWVLLATLDFTGDGTEYIEVSDVNGKAIADAVRLVEVVDTTPQVSTAIYYVHNDHLGTPKALTDATGAKVWSATHDPFGLASVDAGSTVEFNVRFPGQYYDRETGLHYNYFRYYDPGTGRYLTSDPVGLQAGLNTYAYVENNTLRWIDPYGLETKLNLFEGANGAGHLGLQPGNDPSRGKYPRDANIQTDLKNVLGIDVPGIIARDTANLIDSITFQTTPDEENQIRDCINSFQNTPYDLYGDSCVAPPRKCLNEIGIKLDSSIIPKIIFRNLKNSLQQSP